MDAEKIIEENRILVEHKKAVMAVLPKARSRLGKSSEKVLPARSEVILFNNLRFSEDNAVWSLSTNEPAKVQGIGGELNERKPEKD